MSTDQKGDESPAKPHWSKEERQADAIQAKADHDANAIAVEENTARLRALRLNKEAEDLEAERKLAASAKRKASRKRTEAKKVAEGKAAAKKSAAEKSTAKKSAAEDPTG
ncbi:MAG TPA: hypothetical protein VLQ65_04880 [Saliniramus sp.]|nr:hypothetical protein [Saliniramus sp.]